jgi:hypothetical protein
MRGFKEFDAAQCLLRALTEPFYLLQNFATESGRSANPEIAAALDGSLPFIQFKQFLPGVRKR